MEVGARLHSSIRMADHPSSFQSQPLNRTVVAAIWVLALVAFFEVVLASIHFAPSVLTAIRNNAAASQANATPSTATATPAPSIQTPIANPLEHSPVKDILKTSDASSTDVPFQPRSPDASLQGGNTLGIVSVKLDGSSDGPKKLVIAMKAHSKEAVDVPQVKVQVFFYDDDGNGIAPSKAQSVSKWLSSGTDWKDGEPELLEVRYLPDSADSEIKFAGYVVAIYYKGDLQDYRAEPSRLTKLFPLKYFIGTDE